MPLTSLSMMFMSWDGEHTDEATLSDSDDGGSEDDDGDDTPRYITEEEYNKYTSLSSFHQEQP